MTYYFSPNLETYREAIRNNDPAGASKAWRHAQQTGNEAERNAMIQTLDFAVVENYSMAQEAGDLETMAAIWTKALHAPDTTLAWFLDLISKRHQDAEAIPEETKEEDATRSRKTRDLLNRLLAGASPKKTATAQHQTPVPRQGLVSDLLAFVRDPGLQSVCGLTPSDIKALAAVEHLGLPGTDSLDSVKQWATHHQLVFSDLQIEKIRKAALLLQNRMAPADANMLAMAARSALGKKGKGPTPSAPAQEQPQTSPENDPKATNRGLPE
jgi:hypothetical protein